MARFGKMEGIECDSVRGRVGFVERKAEVGDVGLEWGF